MANYIHPTAVIGPNVQLGDNNYIGPFCIIGFPAEHKGFWELEEIPREYRTYANDGQLASHYIKIEHVVKTGKVIIGNNNVFTGMVTVDAGTETDTVIFNNVWMLKHSHVGHDAIIHDNVTISCGAKVGGHAIVHNKCNLGLNCAIHQRLIIPEGCMIGMGAIMTKKTSLEAFKKYAGVPAKIIGDNKI